MAVYQIVKIGSPVLREKASEVKQISPTIEKLLNNMADTLYAAEGLGLAAPQIGVSKRVVVIDIGEGDGLLELINPVILEKNGNKVASEACLSIPGKTGEVARAYKVRVQALNRQGEMIDIKGEGLLARALQHEIDHLDGVLFVDIARKTHSQ